MGKLLINTTGGHPRGWKGGKYFLGLFAMVGLMSMGEVARAQEYVICNKATDVYLCNDCYSRANGDKLELLKCDCKAGIIKGFANPGQCIKDLGINAPGGPKIAQGPMFQGDPYGNLMEAFQAGLTFLEENELDDNHILVYQDLSEKTLNPDAAHLHLFGVPNWFTDFIWSFQPNFQPCGEEGSCQLMMSSPMCTLGVNQDGCGADFFCNTTAADDSLGCQPGAGCKELPPSVWQAHGCPGGIGCCSTTSPSYRPAQFDSAGRKIANEGCLVCPMNTSYDRTTDRCVQDPTKPVVSQNAVRGDGIYGQTNTECVN